MGTKTTQKFWGIPSSMVLLEIYLPRSDITLQPMWVPPHIVTRCCSELKITVDQSVDLKNTPRACNPVSREAQGTTQCGQELCGQSRGTAQEGPDTGKILFSKEKRAPWCWDMMWRRRNASLPHDSAVSLSSEGLFTTPCPASTCAQPSQSQFRELPTPPYLPVALHN